MMEMFGSWNWICEVERRRRGHCIGGLEESNRKSLLLAYLIELNLEFDLLFPSYYSPSFSSVYPVCIQICTCYKNESMEFVRLEELKEPRVKEIEGQDGLWW